MRLIDVDKITDEEIIDYLGIRYASCLDDVRNLLNAMPTAYDVEAVVKELEAKVKFYESREQRQMELDCGFAACHTNGVQQGIKFTIDVVKRGGRNE